MVDVGGSVEKQKIDGGWVSGLNKPGIVGLRAVC